MTVRTALLGAAVVNSFATVTLGTVPAGQTWIVKSCYVTSLTAVDGTAELWWHRTSPAFSAPIVVSPLPITAPFAALDLFAVGLPGDQLQAFADSTQIVFWVSGAKLAGIAP